MSQPQYPDPNGGKFNAPPTYYEAQHHQGQPPPAGFIAPPGPVIIQPGATTTHVIVSQSLGPYSTRMTCPHCNADITTSVEYESGAMTHIIALVLCFVGCWPCCCIPYCVEGCQDARHRCPNCKRDIGVSKRL